MYRYFLPFLLVLLVCASAFGNFDDKKPKIVGQKSLIVLEDESLSISTSDLTIEVDEEDDEELTLEVSSGENYSVNGTIITPDLNFSGTLVVDIKVINGDEESDKFKLEVAVSAVNDPPVITGQVALETNEDQSITLQLTDLVVSDPDNIYPDDFTMELSAGENYVVAGSVITPTAQFSGALTVPVTVDDGLNTSAPFNVNINVIEINDVPVISGQSALQTDEGGSLVFELSDLTVNDADNTYPDDFTFTLSGGINYTVSGATITPSTEFSGTLSVPVIVNDGASSSAPFNVQITVNAVNDAPVITEQVPLQVAEDQPLTLTLQNLTVTDPDNTYPTGFTLLVSTGDNYSVSGNIITPATGFSGVLNVSVIVNDGTANSVPFNVQITVDAVNDAPVITGQVPLQIAEDQPLTLTLQNLTVTDSDNTYPTGFTLSVSTGDNYSVSGTTVTPATGFSGTLSVPVTVNDGTSNSAPFNVQITVDAVNDAPVITGHSALQTGEDQSITLALSNLIVTDPDNTYPTGFTLAISTGDNYSVSGNIITPIADYNGTLSVPVTVNDGGSNSAPFNIQILVLPVNDAPEITGQIALTTNEDQPVVINLADLTVTDKDNTYPSGFSISVSAGTNYTVSGSTVTPIANFTGTLTVPVTVSDGTSPSALFNVAIQVVPVNDAPVISGQVPLKINEDNALTILLSQLIVTDADNIYPSGFTLTIAAGTNYTVSGATVTPLANFAGMLTVPVTVNDGVTNSVPFNLAILVEAANDAPVITGQLPLQMNEDNMLTILLTHITATDTDNTYPQGFTLIVSEGNNYTLSGATITPILDFSGLLTVPVVVNDGTSNSNKFDLQINVNPINDIPVITGQNTLIIYKNKTITPGLSNLIVTDVDNNYPDGFTLKIGQGENYEIFESVVTPNADFIGTLSIPVTINDGAANSANYNLKVDVVLPPNVKPVIISQITLTTYENLALELQLSNLVVTDPDNRFPDDFTLAIFPGEHYTINGNTIIPEKDYSGTLSVKVTVSDKESTSEAYNVVIFVLPLAKVPLITSQSFLRINEDDSLVLKFEDLIVIDPDNNYPQGFRMSVALGNDYSIAGLQIKPSPNFNGYLSVPVTVNDGVNNSIPYQLLILVDPVNDAPVITEIDPGKLFFAAGKGSLNIFERILISDVDDDTLSLAEINIDPQDFEIVKDTLMFSNTNSIRGVLDRAAGLLVLFGKASIEDYKDAIRSIQYDYLSTTKSTKEIKRVNLNVSDGKATSKNFEKVINFGAEVIALDIPSGFTPNDDGANDTWIITTTEGNETFSNAKVRVYNKRGALVFETTGIQNDWDGTMNGILLPADSYFYTIDLNSGVAKNRYKGIVTILR